LYNYLKCFNSDVNNGHFVALYFTGFDQEFLHIRNCASDNYRKTTRRKILDFLCCAFLLKFRSHTRTVHKENNFFIGRTKLVKAYHIYTINCQNSKFTMLTLFPKSAFVGVIVKMGLPFSTEMSWIVPCICFLMKNGPFPYTKWPQRKFNS
jgi:hypothetical protein